MSQAVARFLERERAGVSASIDELNEHRAFRAAVGGERVPE
jgi:predicted N-acyltransferase